MEKEFIPYEQALALKELGFNEPCFKWYGNKNKIIALLKDENILNTKFIKLGKKVNHLCTAPLYQQAFRWFREKYNLLASPKINEFHDRFYFTIKATEPRLMKEIILKREINYEEAELECLKKLIEIVKNGKK